MFVENKYLQPLKIYLKKTDWKLLVFLILFLNVKIFIKLIALVFIYTARPDFRFRFRIKGSRLPLFYLIVSVIATINYFIYAGYHHTNYSYSFLTGIAFWMLCILSIHQVKLATELSPPEHIHRALLVFFMLNILFSAINLVFIQLEIGEWNPYTYQGMYQKYFIGTGDYIKGISFDTSTTNAVINAFGICYFLFRKKMLLVLCCLAALLLTCSNFINIVVIVVLLYCFLFQSTRNQKSIIVVCICMLFLFMAKISPQNNDYAVRTTQHFLHKPIIEISGKADIPVELRVDSVLSDDEKKYKTAKLYVDSLKRMLLLQHGNEKKDFLSRPVIPVANIHSAPYQHKQDSSEARLQVIQLAIKLGEDTAASSARIQSGRVPGKLLAIKESIGYFQQHPARVITGTGIGNFSSKLAFRTTGLKVAGGYPKKYVYINGDFLHNHLAIFLDYFGKDSGFHSITNSPNSVYMQLMSEYGIAGLIALFCFYLWFFLKDAGKNYYAIPVLLILAAVFFIDYWFEQLSVIVLCELLLFLNKKENSYKAVL